MELAYFEHGGILHYVVRKLISSEWYFFQSHAHETPAPEISVIQRSVCLYVCSVLLSIMWCFPSVQCSKWHASDYWSKLLACNIKYQTIYWSKQYTKCCFKTQIELSLQLFDVIDSSSPNLITYTFTKLILFLISIFYQVCSFYIEAEVWTMHKTSKYILFMFIASDTRCMWSPIRV